MGNPFDAVKGVWDDTVGKVIGGAGPELLSIAGGYLSNVQSQETAREQMRFQERMSNTAHQRQVADLKAAGLNPILSAKYGGSSSPGGARAEQRDIITPAVTTGLQAKQVQSTVKVNNQTVVKMEQEVRNLINTFDLIGQQKWVLEAEKMLKDMSIKEKAANIKIMKETVEIQKKNAQISEIKYNALNEAITQLAKKFGMLEFLLPGN